MQNIGRVCTPFGPTHVPLVNFSTNLADSRQSVLLAEHRPKSVEHGPEICSALVELGQIRPTPPELGRKSDRNLGVSETTLAEFVEFVPNVLKFAPTWTSTAAGPNLTDVNQSWPDLSKRRHAAENLAGTRSGTRIGQHRIVLRRRAMTRVGTVLTARAAQTVLRCTKGCRLAGNMHQATHSARLVAQVARSRAKSCTGSPFQVSNA